MKINTFFQLCIYICIVLIVFNLAINFVNATGIFYTVESGVPVGVNATETFGNETTGFLEGGSITGMEAIWDIGISLGFVGVVLLATAIHSAIPIGVYIFSAIFWVSYHNALGVLTDLYIPAEFLLIGTVMMLFFWCGAVAGMFSGSG